MSLDVDMRDPQVRRLIGDGPEIARPGQRELVQLAGDAPDPTGLTGNRGFQSSINLAAGKHIVVVEGKDFVLEVDVYVMPNEPLRVQLICPRCHNHLTVPGERKAIDFDPRAGDPAKGGRLSIEPFECTWEAAGAGQHVPGLVAGGMSLCRWRAAIDNNVAKDA